MIVSRKVNKGSRDYEKTSFSRLSFYMVMDARKMTIGEYLKKNDIDAYRKICANFGFSSGKKKKIELGDTAENLMRHDSYRRQGGENRASKVEIKKDNLFLCRI